MRYGEYTGHHRGLRAGHASTGVTRELGRAKGFLGDKSGVGVPPSVGKTPGVERKRPPFTRALGDQGTQSQRRDPRDRGRRGRTERPRGRPLAVVAAHSTEEGGEPTSHGTHGREGDAGHNDIWREL